MIEKRSFGTHSGSFHADEVTACALLLLFDLIDYDKIHRTRDINKLKHYEYVCDVGGEYDSNKKRFDHHQIDYQGSLSSAGMVLLYLYQSQIIDKKFFSYLRDTLVLGVDLHDNGKIQLETGVCSFSHIISQFMPIDYQADNAALDAAYLQALDFTVQHLRRVQSRFIYSLQCKKDVEKEMLKNADCLFFDKAIPWLESFFSLGGESHPAKFVLMPTHEHWKLRGIPPNLQEKMQVRIPLPQKWAGLQEKELQKVTGIQGAVFCHKGRFISIWKTKEDALKALEQVRKMNQI